MTFVWILVMIMVPVGLAYQLYRWLKLQSKQADMEDAVLYFIKQHSIEQCKPGFYDKKETLLAKQLEIDENTAYQLLSIKLNRLLGHGTRKSERNAFRKVIQEYPELKM